MAIKNIPQLNIPTSTPSVQTSKFGVLVNPGDVRTAEVDINTAMALGATQGQLLSSFGKIAEDAGVRAAQIQQLKDTHNVSKINQTVSDKYMQMQEAAGKLTIADDYEKYLGKYAGNYEWLKKEFEGLDRPTKASMVARTEWGSKFKKLELGLGAKHKALQLRETVVEANAAQELRELEVKNGDLSFTEASAEVKQAVETLAPLLGAEASTIGQSWMLKLTDLSVSNAVDYSGLHTIKEVEKHKADLLDDIKRQTPIANYELLSTGFISKQEFIDRVNTGYHTAITRVIGEISAGNRLHKAEQETIRRQWDKNHPLLSYAEAEAGHINQTELDKLYKAWGDTALSSDLRVAIKRVIDRAEGYSNPHIVADYTTGAKRIEFTKLMGTDNQISEDDLHTFFQKETTIDAGTAARIVEYWRNNNVKELSTEVKAVYKDADHFVYRIGDTLIEQFIKGKVSESEEQMFMLLTGLSQNEMQNAVDYKDIKSEFRDITKTGGGAFLKHRGGVFKNATDIIQRMEELIQEDANKKTGIFANTQATIDEKEIYLRSVFNKVVLPKLGKLQYKTSETLREELSKRVRGKQEQRYYKEFVAEGRLKALNRPLTENQLDYLRSMGALPPLPNAWNPSETSDPEEYTPYSQQTDTPTPVPKFQTTTKRPKDDKVVGREAGGADVPIPSLPEQTQSFVKMLTGQTKEELSKQVSEGKVDTMEQLFKNPKVWIAANVNRAVEAVTGDVEKMREGLSQFVAGTVPKTVEEGTYQVSGGESQDIGDKDVSLMEKVKETVNTLLNLPQEAYKKTQELGPSYTTTPSGEQPQTAKEGTYKRSESGQTDFFEPQLRERPIDAMWREYQNSELGQAIGNLVRSVPEAISKEAAVYGGGDPKQYLTNILMKGLLQYQQAKKGISDTASSVSEATSEFFASEGDGNPKNPMKVADEWNSQTKTSGTHNKRYKEAMSEKDIMTMLKVLNATPKDLADFKKQPQEVQRDWFEAYKEVSKDPEKKSKMREYIDDVAKQVISLIGPNPAEGYTGADKRVARKPKRVARKTFTPAQYEYNPGDATLAEKRIMQAYTPDDKYTDVFLRLFHTVRNELLHREGANSYRSIAFSKKKLPPSLNDFTMLDLKELDGVGERAAGLFQIKYNTARELWNNLHQRLGHQRVVEFFGKENFASPTNPNKIRYDFDNLIYKEKVQEAFLYPLLMEETYIDNNGKTVYRPGLLRFAENMDDPVTVGNTFRGLAVRFAALPIGPLDIVGGKHIGHSTSRWGAHTGKKNKASISYEDFSRLLYDSVKDFNPDETILDIVLDKLNILATGN